MQIYIKTLTGKSQAYTFESDQTILQVKQVRNFNIWYPFSILSRIIAIPLPTPFWFYSIIPLASSREGRFGGCTNTSRVPGEANVGPFDPSRVRSGGRRNHAYGAAAQRRLGLKDVARIYFNHCLLQSVNPTGHCTVYQVLFWCRVFSSRNAVINKQL